MYMAAGPAAVGLVVSIILAPETRGRTLAEASFIAPGRTAQDVGIGKS